MTEYDKFINNIIETRGQWGIPEEEYFEAHHIVPRCIGGEGRIRNGGKYNKHPNIIWLYAEEHFIAHKILAIETNNPKLILAWSMMAFPKGKTKRNFPISPEDYARLREMQSKAMVGTTRFLKSGHPWNYGLTKETDERIKRYGELSRHQRKPVPEKKICKKDFYEQLKKINGDGCLCEKNDDNAIRMSVSNDKYVFFPNIRKDYVDKIILPDGFYFGNVRTGGNHDMSGYTEEMRHKRSLLSSGKNNNMYGCGYKLVGGKNGHATIRYFYNDNTFECRDDLMVYLKNNGYPNISESTIRRIMRGQYGIRTTKKFQDVIDRLRWEQK